MKLFVLVAFPLIWIIACYMPAFSSGISGGSCAFFGWTMSFENENGATFAWLANFPAILGWWCYLLGADVRMKVIAIVLSGLALLMSFGVFTVEVIQPGFTAGPPDHVHVTHGAFAWMLSIALILAGSIVQYRKRSR